MVISTQELAILSLDAYNRDTNPTEVKMLDSNGAFLSEEIGNAIFDFNSADVNVLPLSTASGFSASKYTLSSGETVIAYRGTDFDFSTGAGISSFLVDVIEGWLTSFGVLPPDQHLGMNLQPHWAAEFYKHVTGRPLLPVQGNLSPTVPSNLILTGHSLGGAIAANDNTPNFTRMAA